MRYFVSFLITIGLIILVFILILKGFGGGSTTPTAKPLVDYASTSTIVQMTTDGPVSADQTHQQLQIIVGQDQATINILQGYQGTVVSTQSYSNNQTAYANLLRALDLAGFTKENTSPDLTDDRGYCPLGNRYVFEVINNSKDIDRSWTTSCTQDPHSFDGNLITVQDLFAAQIPNFNTLTQSLNTLIL